jgi:uncharacterized protein (DUF2235 family)
VAPDRVGHIEAAEVGRPGPRRPQVKNIVICSDGTGQSYTGTGSNVLRLFNLALNDRARQIRCYDPGVGTLPLPSGRTRLGRALRHDAELALGSGVMQNVMELYTYLMQHYQPDDRIFLFGFSRGAFTVRALAGMLHVCGLLRREDAHLRPYAAGLYQTAESRIAKERRSRRLLVNGEPSASPIDHAIDDPEARQFKSLLGRTCAVAFMGIWDTVKAYGWIWPQSFPALRHNPAVLIVRHAVALDERRAAFQVTGWGDRYPDVKEVWFAGDHSDVGGGHVDGSPLADATLTWMLGEATHAGLFLDATQRSAIQVIVASSRNAPSAQRHDLRRGAFRVLDWAPRLELDNSTYPPQRRFRCWPTGGRQPRAHAEGTPLRLHHSALERGRNGDAAYLPGSVLGRSRVAHGRVSTGKCSVLEEWDREIVVYENVSMDVP